MLNTDESSLTRMSLLLYHEELDSHSTHAYYDKAKFGKPHPSIVTIITEFNVSTPPGLNCSQMPSHVPGWGGGGGGGGGGIVRHYFNRCITQKAQRIVCVISKFW